MKPKIGSKKIYTVHEAKTHLSAIIKQVEKGEEVIIARGDKPAVKLVSVKEPFRRQFGFAKGQIVIHPSFYEYEDWDEFL